MDSSDESTAEGGRSPTALNTYDCNQPVPAMLSQTCPLRHGKIRVGITQKSVNPQLHSSLDGMPATVWSEFMRCATRMLKAAPESANLTIKDLTKEYSQYQNLEGTFTAEVLALAQEQAPHLWWQQWGKVVPSIDWSQLMHQNLPEVTTRHA